MATTHMWAVNCKRGALHSSTLIVFIFHLCFLLFCLWSWYDFHFFLQQTSVYRGHLHHQPLSSHHYQLHLHLLLFQLHHSNPWNCMLVWFQMDFSPQLCFSVFDLFLVVSASVTEKTPGFIFCPFLGLSRTPRGQIFTLGDHSIAIIGRVKTNRLVLCSSSAFHTIRSHTVVTAEGLFDITVSVALSYYYLHRVLSLFNMMLMHMPN